MEAKEKRWLMIAANYKPVSEFSGESVKMISVLLTLSIFRQSEGGQGSWNLTEYPGFQVESAQSF